MNARSRLSMQSTISRRAVLAGVAALALGSHGARAGLAQTPAPVDGGTFEARLLALLAMVPPVETVAGALLAPPFYYADLAAQLASVGIEQPDPGSPLGEMPEGFSEATLGLPLAANAYQRGPDDDWFEVFGFEPFAVHRALTLNVSSDVTTVFAGGIDTARVAEALAASGYEEHDQGQGESVWSYPDDEITSPVFRLGLGSMHHAVIFDDAVVFSQELAAAEAVAQVAAGDEPAMAQESVWPNLLPMFSDDIVGLVPLLAESIQSTSTAMQGTPVATPALGGLRHLAFGIRAGAINTTLSLVGQGTPEVTPESDFESEPARIEVRLRYESEQQAAEQAELIPQLWSNGTSTFSGQPLTSMMTVESAAVSEMDPTVAAVNFTTVGATNAWIQLIQGRDLVPFIPAEG